MPPRQADARAAFIDAACVPLDRSHASGTLEDADAILAANPDIVEADIHTAAILGADAVVRRLLAADPSLATAKCAPRDWDALTHLCFSRYLRLDHARSPAFVKAAEALLDAGANPNTGFYSNDHLPAPEFESALYGAAGVAHHAGVTRLLLERGADPNDGEVSYHAPEGFDNEAMMAIVESGKLSTDSLCTMLHRKLNWTDYAAAEWLLNRGADANHLSHWGKRSLHAVLGFGNPLRYVELLLLHGADPSLLAKDGRSAFAMAARMGRADVLDLFEQRAFQPLLGPEETLLAACARGEDMLVRDMIAADPALAARVVAQGDPLLIDFAGTGSFRGVSILLDLGTDIAAQRANPPWLRGETALHVAIWRERLATVELLLRRGAPLETAGVNGETPLSLSVRAQVEQSEWTPHNSTAILEALLVAGAKPGSVKRFPSGSDRADALLRRALESARS